MIREEVPAVGAVTERLKGVVASIELPTPGSSTFTLAS
jgi:hypothetical protein